MRQSLPGERSPRPGSRHDTIPGSSGTRVFVAGGRARGGPGRNSCVRGRKLRVGKIPFAPSPGLDLNPELTEAAASPLRTLQPKRGERTGSGGVHGVGGSPGQQSPGATRGRLRPAPAARAGSAPGGQEPKAGTRFPGRRNRERRGQGVKRGQGEDGTQRALPQGWREGNAPEGSAKPPRQRR